MELESTITNTITSPTSTGPLTVTASGANSAASVASTASTSTLAITSSTSLQPISSQAPVIGEKYYFSKTPISNDVAKAAAETVMAIASSALNASSSKSSSVVTKSESSNSTACPTTNGTIPVKNSSNQIVTGPAVSIISIDAKSEQPEIIAPQSSALVTKPITFLSIVDSKTKINMPLGTKILDSSGACLEHHPGSSIGSNSVREVIHLDQGPPGAELQAYLQAKAMKAATVRMPIIHEETSTSVSGHQHRIGSLTIERAPAPISVISSMPNNQDNQQNSNQHLQGPRNVTMNVMDMPSSLTGSGNNHQMPSSLTGTGSHQLTSRKSLHLPQDVQLISVGHSQIQAPKPLRNTELSSQATSISAASAASNMASPPNKTCQEAIKAENIQEQQNLKEDKELGLRIERPTASTPSSTGSINSSSSSSSSAGGKYVCNVCKKDFPTNALLNIHAKIHYFERPYRCDACAVSFRTNGHLQKHKRSSSHFNKVNINATFGEPSTSNPRPFYCGDCKIGFRIHGHLAKHLRSKSHIMKLENSGKLPIGMFAEMERLGTNLNEIDTSDCEASLESLKQMATR